MRSGVPFQTPSCTICWLPMFLLEWESLLQTPILQRRGRGRGQGRWELGYHLGQPVHHVTGFDILDLLQCMVGLNLLLTRYPPDVDGHAGEVGMCLS